VSGYQSFAVIGDGNTTYYAITSGTAWEVGIGTYTASGTTLSRDTILSSSNANAAITLAGTSNVFVTFPAYAGEKVLYNWVEGVNTAAPNATVPVTYFTPSNAATNVDAALTPKGTGALAAQVADNTTTGGDKRGIYAVDWQRQRGLATEVASGIASVVGGGMANTASGNYSVVAGGGGDDGNLVYGNVASGDYSFVGGGYDNTASNGGDVVCGGTNNTASGGGNVVCGGESNTASGVNAFVGAGAGNAAAGYHSFIGAALYGTASADGAFVGGGYENTASGVYSFVGGGINNAASGEAAAVCGGDNNTASGDGSFIGGGYNNVASGQAATIAGGNGATTRGLSGAEAFAAGYFSAVGDAQRALYVAIGATTDATPLILTFGQGAASTTNQVVLPNDATYFFKVSVIARRTDADNESAAYTFEGCIDRNANAASTALVGTPVKTILAEDTSAWDVAVSADTTNGALAITVTGQAAKTIRWVAKIETVEVVG
jgi:hypothetical protein